MKTKSLTDAQKIETTRYKEATHIVLGSLYIALLAQIEIPLHPVPITLHTFAIFTLGLFQGGKKAFLSLMLYLLEATMGLPVFPGAYANPFWFLGPTAGYCLSFPIAAYICGKCTEFKTNTPIYQILIGLLCAQGLIYGMGVAWLSLMIGWKQALIVGLYPFIMFDFLKLFTAASIKMAACQIKKTYERST